MAACQQGSRAPSVAAVAIIVRQRDRQDAGTTQRCSLVQTSCSNGRALAAPVRLLTQLPRCCQSWFAARRPQWCSRHRTQSELVTFAVIVHAGHRHGMVPPVAYVTEFPPTTPDLVPVQVPPNVAFASVTCGQGRRIGNKCCQPCIVGKSDCRDTGTTDTQCWSGERLDLLSARWPR